MATADFSAVPTSGSADLFVQFTDTSTGGPTSWLWDFGDGSTSTLQNPSHTYVTAGIYTVSLTVDGPGIEIKTDYITVNLLASYVAALDTEEGPYGIQFTDASKGQPNDWGWDFGDGSGATGIQNPVHTYSSKDNYKVNFTVFRTP